MVNNEIKDITIIGAGPSGLFTAFQAGMYEASTRIIDSMPEPGGQLTALYPEKYIFDVPGFTKITAKDLARNLFEQANQFNPEIRLGETVIDILTTLNSDETFMNQKLTKEDENPSPFFRFAQCKQCPSPLRGEGGVRGGFEIVTDKGRYLSRAVIIASGLGAFKPRTSNIPGIERFEGKGVYYIVKEKGLFKEKDVVIVGGGDSALDWVINLLDTAGDITLVHRRETFRAQPGIVQQVYDSATRGRIKVLTPYEVKGVSGGNYLEKIIIGGLKGEDMTLRADALLLMLGFTSDIGLIEKWGLDIDDNRVKVKVNMETNRKGIFAVGDIANYPGKLKLILTGFSDGALAVRSAAQYIRPGDKVRHVHSTSLRIFE